MDKELTELEKVNGCMALLIQLCMLETNANEMTLKTEGLTYKDKLLGDYEITIKKLKPNTTGEKE